MWYNRIFRGDSKVSLMKKFALVTDGLSIAWFVSALTIPALAMKTSIPINAISAPLLSLHVVSGTVCAFEMLSGCLVFTATQYGLNYWILYSEYMTELRNYQHLHALFWCMSALTTTMVLVLLVVAFRFRCAYEIEDGQRRTCRPAFQCMMRRSRQRISSCDWMEI